MRPVVEQLEFDRQILVVETCNVGVDALAERRDGRSRHGVSLQVGHSRCRGRPQSQSSSEAIVPQGLGAEDLGEGTT